MAGPPTGRVRGAPPRGLRRHSASLAWRPRALGATAGRCPFEHRLHNASMAPAAHRPQHQGSVAACKCSRGPGGGATARQQRQRTTISSALVRAAAATATATAQCRLQAKRVSRLRTHTPLSTLSQFDRWAAWACYFLLGCGMLVGGAQRQRSALELSHGKCESGRIRQPICPFLAHAHACPSEPPHVYLSGSLERAYFSG